MYPCIVYFCQVVMPPFCYVFSFLSNHQTTRPSSKNAGSALMAVLSIAGHNKYARRKKPDLNKYRKRPTRPHIQIKQAAPWGHALPAPG
jgi:hypothetical protein